MSYILFFSVYFLIKIISVSSSSKYFQILQNNINNYLAEEIPIEFLSKIDNCLENYANSTFENRSYILGKCVINVTKENVDILAKLLKNPDTYNFIKLKYPNLDSIDDTGRLKRFYYALNESANNQSTILIDLLYNSFSIKDEFNLTLLDYFDYLLDIVEEAKKDESKLDRSEILTNISILIRKFEINDLYDYIRATHYELFFDLVEMFVTSTPTFNDLYHNIMKVMEPFKNETITFIIDMIRNYENRTQNIELIFGFLLNNPQTFDALKELLNNKTYGFGDLFKELIKYEDPIANAIKDSLVDNQTVSDVFFDIIKQTNGTEIAKEGVSLIINIKNLTYIMENLPSLLKSIRDVNEILFYDLIDCMMIIAGNLNGQDKLNNIATTEIKNALSNFFIEYQHIENYDISDNCMFLYNNTFFENTTSTKDELFLLYLKKFVFDSPINKGDFLSFDNCLNDKITYTDVDPKNNRTYQIEPAFVIGIFENKKNRMDFKNTTFFEKYYYITNYCLPFGYLNSNKDNSMCTDGDYNLLIQFISNFFENANDTDFKTIVLNKENTKLKGKNFLIGIFSIIVLAIPFLIKIFLMVNKCYNDKKNDKINKLIGVGKKEKKVNNKNELSEGKDIPLNNKNNKEAYYKKVLNECFDFLKNGSELFNFDLNNTNFNNVNGITYIKGLIGVSIILTVFGLTYKILVNLPMKEYGSWYFYKSIKSCLYCIIFIGYRYSPRVLFSCSGYTLIYKYLCYIEQEQGYYFLKFVFLQSYKYILLYIVLLLFNFSIHEIIYLFHGVKRPAWVLFEHYIEEKKIFFGRAFSLLFDFSNFDEDYKQNIIYHFYIPLNEIFFFIFGTILISLGYKYKLRIDYIIISFFSILLIFKIIIYCTYFYEKKRMIYSTTDYYLFDFGIHFLNPLYNLSFFLIGMFFGLINYSIQKGITDIYKKDNSYKKLIPLEEQKPYQQKEEEDSDMNSNLLDNDNDTLNNSEEKILNLSVKDINNKDNKKIEKLMAKEGTSSNEIKEYNEQIKKMPFLIIPIQFLNLNKNKKSRTWYNLLIFLALVILALLSFSKTIALYALSELKEESSSKDYITQLSLEKTITNNFLNILYIIDNEIVVFISHWIIFILFFKESAVLRGFCNNIFWSFFVKSYFPFILISVPIILCIFYESESVIKIHIYNFLLYSLINFIFIFIGVIIFYSIYEMPLKKIFKYILKGKEIIDEDDENEKEEEEEEEKEEEDNKEIEENEEEEISLKS